MKLLEIPNSIRKYIDVDPDPASPDQRLGGKWDDRIFMIALPIVILGQLIKWDYYYDGQLIWDNADIPAFFRWRLANLFDPAVFTSALNRFYFVKHKEHSRPLAATGGIFTLGVMSEIAESYTRNAPFDCGDVTCYAVGAAGYLTARRYMTGRWTGGTESLKNS